MKVLADYIFPEKVKTLEWLANNIYQTFKKAFSCCLCEFLESTVSDKDIYVIGNKVSV